MPLDDPYLAALQEIAGPGELGRLVPVARRLLEAAGVAGGDLPDGEALIDGLYPLAAAAYIVRGRDDPVFRAAMGFILDPDALGSVIDAWRLALGLGDDGLAALADGYRRRLGPPA